MIKKIYKFGGASVKDADAVRNLADIVSQHKDEDILLVVSAMGKTTNALEKALANFREHDTTTASSKACSMATPTRDLMKTSPASSSSFGRNCKRPKTPMTTNTTKPYAMASSSPPASSMNTSASAISPPVGLMRANMSLPKMKPTTAPPTPIGMRHASESVS